ncbi:MAG: DegV family protein [Peptococcaceae bacterium]|nr:DegV family protein [Peptococcaceae bacterium]
MFQIFTDTSANIPTADCRAQNIQVIPLYYYIDEEEHTCLDTDAFDGASYYAAIAGGKQVTTSQITPGHFVEAFEPHLAAGEDILYVAMAQRISGSYDSAMNAAEMLAEKYPERQIAVINTKGAGLGEGIPTLEAARCRDAGMDFAQTVAQVERCVRYIYQIFTVDDLNYLGRTGRCSNFTAFFGSALNIKPLLKGSDDGVIVTFEKARGRKKAIKMIVEHYAEAVDHPENQTIYISHANCPDDAEALAAQLREAKAPREVRIIMHEPVTGAHIGPGSLALFFISGHNRDTGKDDFGYWA